MKDVNIIVAITADNAIGRGGDLIYRLKDDMRHFKEITMGHTIIMGRKTWESLPKGALPGRRNVVVSRNADYAAPGAEVYTSLQEALQQCANAGKVFVIGGAQIYAQALPVAERLYLTAINAEAPDADTFFPEIDHAEWTVESSEPMQTDVLLTFKNRDEVPMASLAEGHYCGRIEKIERGRFRLEEGMLTFDGPVNAAIDRYIRVPEAEAERRIVDCIAKKKSWLEITKIELNGTEARRSTIVSGQDVLTLLIEGETDESMQTDPMLIFKNRDGIPMVSLAEGHTHGRIEKIEPGYFRIERIIRLPRLLSAGDYVVDIHLHHPMVEYQMQAPLCAEICVEGYSEDFGRALRVNDEGFFGLETLE